MDDYIDAKQANELEARTIGQLLELYLKGQRASQQSGWPRARDL
jgi:hypothetical protein